MPTPKKKKRPLRIASLDTETTGLDLFHGARPYFVSLCTRDPDGELVNSFWRWTVDPYTREVEFDVDDMVEINEELSYIDVLVLQNPKFDYRGLSLAYRDAGVRLEWDWRKVRDTLLAGHLLNSGMPHDLTTMTLMYLGVDSKPFDDRLRDACLKARSEAKSRGWMIASKDDPMMPSVRGESWKMDGWIPDQLADEMGYPNDHPWRGKLEEYGNSDTATNLALYEVMSGLIDERGLGRIYEERMKLPGIVAEMEMVGVTISGDRLDQQTEDYRRASERSGRICTRVAEKFKYKLELPKSGNNKSLLNFVFDELDLPVMKKSKTTGAPSLDQAAVSGYLASLPEGSVAHEFMSALADKRKRDTAVGYMDGYRRFMIRVPSADGWYVMHPSLNPTGTSTLRWSSSNPNEQNISKREGFNLRYCFGPAPGREWWSLDYQNLELRIPAYESYERDLIYVFEHPDEPPYFGSYHFVVADLLHHADFVRYGKEFKDKFASTKYKWVKGGNFAVIYGAQKETADRAYHVSGAYEMIRERFPGIAALNDRMIRTAEESGCVETIPDRSVDPSRGYPIVCRESKWGRISPTVPLNYHVQSTAMWITMRAMIECHEYLRSIDGDYRMIMQVHDEIVFDMPARKGMGNLPKVRRLAKIMASAGDGVGVPTPVSIEYHPENWSEGVRV